MTNQQSSVQVAVVQTASVIMEREASTEKAISLTSEAAAKRFIKKALAFS